MPKIGSQTYQPNWCRQSSIIKVILILPSFVFFISHSHISLSLINWIFHLRQSYFFVIYQLYFSSDTMRIPKREATMLSRLIPRYPFTKSFVHPSKVFISFCPFIQTFHFIFSNKFLCTVFCQNSDIFSPKYDLSKCVKNFNSCLVKEFHQMHFLAFLAPPRYMFSQMYLWKQFSSCEIL